MKQLVLLFTLVFASTATNAQLIINELSQGTNSKEYVELLVTGTPTCGAANTVDLRGWIIDDNNSWHASGSGTGIAGGHVRFDSISQWANVKIGSLIVIYNDADTGAAIHALSIDTNDANNDYVYVIPVSSSVLQKNVTLPANNGSMSTYAVPGTVYSPFGNWTCLGMANSGDAFHTVSPANYATPYFAIGWGNNSTAVNVYYSVAQNSKVIYMTNAVSNDPFDSNNFVDSSSTTQETPGSPNNAANATWIHSMNNNGQPFVVPSISFNNPAPLTCGNSSTVIIASSTTSGATFVWSNGKIGTNDTVTAGGTYRVTVSDAVNTCSAVDSITITSSAGLTISAAATSTTCGIDNGSATVTVTLGTATGYAWSSGGNTATISNLAAGIYTVTVNGNGCTATASTTVSVSSGNSVAITTDKTIFCSGDSAQICAPSGHQAYLWSTGATTSCIAAKAAGNYYVTVTDNGTCTAASNHIAIDIHPQPPVSISVNGDTLKAYNSNSYQWYLNNTVINGANTGTYIANQAGSYTVLVSDSNGCTAVSNPVVITGLNDVVIDNGMNIYPNPLANGSWNLEVDNNFIGATVEIFDNNGRLVYKAEISKLKSEFQFDFAKGVYMLKVSSGKNIFTKKLIRL